MSQKFQQICLNGHQLSVTSDTSSDPDEYCPQCGTRVITTCQECNEPIKGWLESEGMIYLGKRTKEKPSYCSKCGKPFPWTKSILESAAELISLDEELTESDKSLIKSAMPDLLVETPKTKVAEAKFKKVFNNASTFLKDSMYNLLVDVLSESVKKSIFPD